MTTATNTPTDTEEIVFQGLLQDQIFVVETAARDLMHPSRTVNTTYVIDTREGSHREVFAGSNAFAHGLTLDQATAEAKIRHYLKRTAS
jgi:hypothetical protein